MSPVSITWRLRNMAQILLLIIRKLLKKKYKSHRISKISKYSQHTQKVI